MKKQIDPNLNNDENIFSNQTSGSANGNGELGFSSDYVEDKPQQEPDFKVTFNDGVAQPNSNGSGSSHHHSSGEHHHHSSGEHHHHSSGEHHHHSSSSSSHHHSKHKKKLPLPVRILIAIFIILLIIIFVVTGTFFYLTKSGKKDLTTTNSDNVEYQEIIEYNGHKYMYNTNVFSLAFIGVDQEDLKTTDETDYVGAADTDIVIAVDTKTGKTSAISIPRDTMVDVDIYSNSGIFLRTENTYLCLAYAYGDGKQQSCQNSVDAISRILYNIPIEKYYALDLSGIGPLNDAIGGVTLDALSDINSYNIKQGDTVTLQGDMAVEYVRHRDTDYLEASLNRVDRQVQYIKAYSQQLAPAVMQDFSVVSNLYSTAKKYSQTNLTLNNATYLASFLISKGVNSFDTYTLTGEMDASEEIDEYGSVHAQFTPDEDYLMETVLSVFYTQID
jgi:LCP family protein required for cell wall assembly